MESINNHQNELKFETLISTLLYLVSKYAAQPEPRLKIIIRQHVESLSVVSANLNMPTLCATTNKLIEQMWTTQDLIENDHSPNSSISVH